LGGTIGLLGELGGVGLIYGGYLYLLDFSLWEDWGDFERRYSTAIRLMMGGLALLGGTRLFECIRPWFYIGDEDNTKNYALSFTPSIDINGNPAALVLLDVKLR
jgi:hypothetical protein